jgi:formate dehydrogenase subunit beta
MNTQWRIQTHGDPLGSVRRILRIVWSQADLDGMLVPLNGSEGSIPTPRMIQDPGLLEHVNPFKPLMTVNAARLVPELIREHPRARLGALLRPCEMRALIEMAKHDGFNLERTFTVSVDCLGTLPLDDYRWRVARKGAPDELAQESLRFARQGGILAYRFRPACQTCTSPEATAADLNIHVLGLPVRQHLLLHASDEAVAGRPDLASLADGPAMPDAISQHDHVIARMSERQRRTVERIEASLGENFPRQVSAVIAMFESCGECQTCLQACPICSVDPPLRNAEGRYESRGMIRWLISCAGCGMCEQACASRLPLSAIFRHIRDLLAEEYRYSPGRSLEDPLPAI